MNLFERERTSAETILYALYLYFLGLSFINTSKAIQLFGKREEGVMLQYGNGFRDSIPDVYTVVKEWQLF
ncbi:MAG: hypothetical protein WBP64_04565 [Nitrososphaeraceae archaeon]